ncbi:MAG: hypothetical protein ABIJ86_14230 [Spirochaetota bacterium]
MSLSPVKQRVGFLHTTPATIGQIPFALLDDAIRQRTWKVPVLYAGEDAWLRLKEILQS